MTATAAGRRATSSPVGPTPSPALEEAEKHDSKLFHATVSSPGRFAFTAGADGPTASASSTSLSASTMVERAASLAGLWWLSVTVQTSLGNDKGRQEQRLTANTEYPCIEGMPPRQ